MYCMGLGLSTKLAEAPCRDAACRAFPHTGGRAGRPAGFFLAAGPVSTHIQG